MGQPTQQSPAGDRRARRANPTGTLRFSSDCEPGIRRLRRGRSFIYLAPDGRRIHSTRELARIRSLAVPPAYRDVWVCRDPRGHLQATGRDARGRKQYRYHPLWRVTRDATKFDRMLQFGRCLPSIRRRVSRDRAPLGVAGIMVGRSWPTAPPYTTSP